MAVIFNTFLHHLATGFDWETDDVRGMLVEKLTWTPDKDDGFVATATGAGAVEVAAASYLRQAISGPAATPDTPGDRELLQASTFDFGNLESGFNYDTFILFTQVTNDADSWLICAVPFTLQTTDGTDVSVVPDADGIFEILQP